MGITIAVPLRITRAPTSPTDIVVSTSLFRGGLNPGPFFGSTFIRERCGDLDSAM